jgi:hypothetical protein
MAASSEAGLIIFSRSNAPSQGSFRPEPKDAAHQAGFVPAMVVAESGPAPGPVGPAGGGAIEIEFAAGARMRITGAVDAATLKAAVAALADGRIAPAKATLRGATEDEDIGV